MRTLLFALAAMAVLQGSAMAQSRSLVNGIIGREEKAGSGTLIAGQAEVRIRRVYIRLDRNGDFFMIVYPDGNARTYTGRFDMEGKRIYAKVTRNGDSARGYVNLTRERNGNGQTFSSIDFNGTNENGSRLRITFRPDRADVAGPEAATSVDEWNRRYGTTGDNDFGGSGGSWGNNFSGDSAGDGSLDLMNRDYDLRRARVRVERDGDARITFSTNRGDVVFEGRARGTGRTFTIQIERARGQRATGTATVETNGRDEVNRITITGSAGGDRIRGNFRRD